MKLLQTLILGSIVAYQTVPVFCAETKPTLEWGFAERQGRRSEMEDTHLIEETGPYAVYAIFDGHGGTRAARYSALSLKKATSIKGGNVTPDMPFPTLDIMTKWTRGVEVMLSFMAASGKEANQAKPDSGTTMISVFVDKKTNEARLFWAGDSRAIVVRNGKVILATEDHTLNVPAEAERAQRLGAVVENGRITNKKLGLRIAMTRSIGDLNIKEGAPAVISEPEENSIQLQKNDWLVIACDGLWDVVSNDVVASFVTNNNPRPVDDNKLPKEGFFEGRPMFFPKNATDTASSEGTLKGMAQALRDLAFNKGSLDNISVIVVKI